MTALAEILTAHRQDYYARSRSQILPSHEKAMFDIAHCRTSAQGGKEYTCRRCHTKHYSYHSCNNRHCPQCGNADITEWLMQQQSLQLPTKYFLVTVTIPQELHGLAYAHQSVVYHLLMRSAAEAVQMLAADQKFLGGRIGLMSILHTWTRDMRYHPHVHMLIPVGGISADADRWIPLPYHEFFIPVPVLAAAFRNQFMRTLKKTDLFSRVSPFVWHRNWIVHCKSAGTGTTVLKYLSPYVKRVAISNNRIERFENGRITYRYKNAKTGTWQRITMNALPFINRFLRHVLPKGFVKIRYYGYLGHNQRKLFAQARTLLAESQTPAESDREGDTPVIALHPERALRCPHCGGQLLFVREIKRSYRNRNPP
jgi:DNA-directed RNA polymerase subunit M/transcription elongation factor TFIIS